MPTKKAAKKKLKPKPKALALPAPRGAVSQFAFGDRIRTRYCGKDIEAWVVTVNPDGSPKTLELDHDYYGQGKSDIGDVPAGYVPRRSRDNNYGFVDAWRLDAGYERPEGMTLLARDVGVAAPSAPAAPRPPRFAVRYELSKDPVEFFATKAEALARIDALIAAYPGNGLKLDSVYLYEIKSEKKVQIATRVVNAL